MRVTSVPVHATIQWILLAVVYIAASDDRTNIYQVDQNYTAQRIQFPPPLFFPQVLQDIVTETNRTRLALMILHNRLSGFDDNIQASESSDSQSLSDEEEHQEVTSVLGKRALDEMWESISKLQSIDHEYQQFQQTFNFEPFIDSLWISHSQRLCKTLAEVSGSLGIVLYTLKLREGVDITSITEACKQLLTLQQKVISYMLLLVFDPNISGHTGFTPNANLPEEQVEMCKHMALAFKDYRSLQTKYMQILDKVEEIFDNVADDFGFPLRGLSKLYGHIIDMGEALFIMKETQTQGMYCFVAPNPQYPPSINVFAVYIGLLVDTHKKRTALIEAVTDFEKVVQSLRNFGVSSRDQSAVMSLVSGSQTPTLESVVNTLDDDITRMTRYVVLGQV